jgi:hypothetical protein
MESISSVSDEPLLEEGKSEDPPPPPKQPKRLRSHRVLLVVRSAAKMKTNGRSALAAQGAPARKRTFLSGSYRMLTKNPLYLMLVFVPPALVSAHIGVSDGIIFALSCCAILPLAGLLGDATEQVPPGKYTPGYTTRGGVQRAGPRARSTPAVQVPPGPGWRVSGSHVLIGGRVETTPL